MEKASLSGQINPYMLGILKKMIFMVLEFIPGKMDAYIVDSGQTIRCTGKEFLLGLMDGSTKANI